jgi:hypothetical protein
MSVKGSFLRCDAEKQRVMELVEKQVRFLIDRLKDFLTGIPVNYPISEDLFTEMIIIRRSNKINVLIPHHPQ